MSYYGYMAKIQGLEDALTLKWAEVFSRWSVMWATLCTKWSVMWATLWRRLPSNESLGLVAEPIGIEIV